MTNERFHWRVEYCIHFYRIGGGGFESVRGSYHVVDVETPEEAVKEVRDIYEAELLWKLVDLPDLKYGGTDLVWCEALKLDY